jgi:hypothetical protein
MRWVGRPSSWRPQDPQGADYTPCAGSPFPRRPAMNANGGIGVARYPVNTQEIPEHPNG